MNKPIAQQNKQPHRPANGKRSYKPLIILPAYNEEKNIRAVVDGIRREAPGFPILVVDDGSRDATADIARRLGTRVISLPYNCGYGVAVQTGFRFAHKNGFNLVIQMDADGQHDCRSIKFLVREILENGTDVVIGSRFLGGDSYKPSLPRRVGIRVFAMLASLLTRRRVTDPTSGFQALKGDAVRFVASDVYPPDYPDADFIILLNRCGFKVREIPVRMHPGPKNKSMHHGSRTMYYIFKMFLSIFVTLLRQKPETY